MVMKNPQSNPTRRKFIATTAAFAGTAAGTAPFISTQAKSETPAMKLAFYTDLHTRVEWDTPKAVLQAADWINQRKPDLIIGGGDFITEGFQAILPVDVAPRWDAYMKAHESFEAPVEVAMGNHDLVCAIPEDGSPGVEDPRAEFRKRFNLEKTYRSFDRQGIHFVILDPFEIVGGEAKFRGFIGEEQMEWFKKDLEKTPVDQPMIVVCHMPLLSVFWQATRASSEAMPTRYIVENGRSIVKLFRGRNVLAVLQGHTHVNATINWRGIQFITGGAVCAKWWRGDWYGTEEGFGILNVQGNRVTWEYVDYEWTARRPVGQ